jgi:1,4-alpha-glucan branching enzyme
MLSKFFRELLRVLQYVIQQFVDNPKSATQGHLGGMGAMPQISGVAFRVWAPNATAVQVIGTFNQWQGELAPMVSEENGHWYYFSPTAKIGDQYKFRVINGAFRADRIDPFAKEVTNSVGAGIIHDPQFDWQEDTRQIPPWNEAVIYEMHIGTFARASEKKIGTFHDALAHFEHLRHLGVNVLQIMPAAEFAGDLSWGYNPANIFAVESSYGGPSAFKEFVREAHRQGFAVILDVVYNHFGPSDLDLWQFDGWSQNNKGGIYFYNDERSATPWGYTRPDYGRGEVRQFIRDNALMWLEEFHVDGLRFDMTLFIRTVQGDGGHDLPDGWGLVQWINREIHSLYANALTIAEDLQDNEYLTKPEAEGGAGFSSQWDAAFVHPIRAVLTTPSDDGRSMLAVRDSILFKYNQDVFQRVIYTESHDEVANGKARVPSEISPGDAGSGYAQRRSTLGTALTLTSPGIPMLFQGQEFLEDGYFQDTVPLDWHKSEEFRGIVGLHADLIRLRRNELGTTRGLTGQLVHVFHVNDQDKLVAFRRALEGGPSDDVVVVLNFSCQARADYKIGMPSSGAWKLRLNTDASVYSKAFTNTPAADMVANQESYDGMPASGTITIGPYSTLIYSQDRVQ